MSEEDIINISERIADFGWSDYDDFEKNKKAIRGLLDLYQKEKENSFKMTARSDRLKVLLDKKKKRIMTKQKNKLKKK